MYEPVDTVPLPNSSKMTSDRAEQLRRASETFDDQRARRLESLVRNTLVQIDHECGLDLG